MIVFFILLSKSNIFISIKQLSFPELKYILKNKTNVKGVSEVYFNLKIS